MVATTNVSKRRPYPYDMYVGDVKVMLELQADGNLVTSKTKTLEATAPIDYTYSSANPYKEKAFEWQELFGGFGQTVAPTSGQPRRYSHSIKCDLSIDGLWMKGPNFEDHVETVGASAGEVRQLIWALHGGAETLFAICENAIYRRVADGNWTISLSDVTLAGARPQQAMRFKHRGTSPVDALYVGVSSGGLWKYDGAAWSTPAAAAGPGVGVANSEARYIERVNDELWVAGDYWVMNVKDNPVTRANWSAPFYVGDDSCKITWLKQLNDSLFIFKEDGIYTIDQDGDVHELFPTLRNKNNVANGRNAAVWLDKLWFTFGDQTFTMDANATLEPDGMEQMLENTSEVHGSWRAGAGHNTWFFYEFYYAADQNKSHMIKHGTWVEENSNQATPGVAQFAEAHHGSVYDWPEKRVTCAEVVANASVSGNDRMYVGFSDGSVQWAYLPKDSPNPADDPICEFTNDDSYVYLPIHHSGFRADNKLFHAVTAMGPRLNTEEWVEVEYRLDTANPLAEWTLVNPDTPEFTLPSQRLPFTTDPVSDAVYGKLAQFRVHLKTNPGSGQTPVIEGIAIHESIRPSFSRDFTFSVKVASHLPRHDGMVDRRRGTIIRDQLLQECARTRPVAVTMPTGEIEKLTIIDYRDSAAAYGKRWDHEWLLQIQAIQLGTISGEDTEPITGLTYATLETYTLGELESII